MSQPPLRPFLTLQEASFRLGDKLVFENTSWQFGRDEHWAVLGTNGSGKSLFADAVRGRLPLVGGELNYHFRPPKGLQPEESIAHVSFADRKLGLREAVAQSRWNSLEEEAGLRVREYLSFERVLDINPFEVAPGRRQARREFELRRRRAVELLGVAPLLERALVSLSNGENQRVQLARALCHPTRLLVLDEPCTGLDAAARTHFHAVLDRLMSRELRVLLVTTRPDDLPRAITHVLQVENCRVIAAGPRSLVAKARTLARQPAKAFLRLRNSRKPAGEGKELVSLRNVTVSYGKSTVLSRLSWTIRAGESWALLGPNGSGKTTLLGLILGDHPQVYANDVTVFGKRPGLGESVWDIKRQIGWVSPELHLHFDESATCFQVAASGLFDTVGLFETHAPWQRRLACEWLDRFGLLAERDTPLYGLSTGLQRMALLARALVKSPRLLVLDEPCQGLDVAHRDVFIRTVDGLIRSGAATTLYVTHRPDEVPPSVQRVLRLPARAEPRR